ncbi:hypothetical protein M7I_7311 [Glarea lozoyensis 74030]|uniref:Uncharacterized protein n=1 Tax=Glarea lozoyensis (strain ATCC 74030 / MF5533) TaxID=1104152 RepID=H0EWY6_GLAL7|nr:hypothetical protein M7I_7311 [Glarea lozoyensis 74030]
MTLYGDDRNKLSVPFVRPEDETLFKNLCTTHVPVETKELKATAAPFTPTEFKPKVEVAPQALASAISEKIEQAVKAPVSEREPQSVSALEPQPTLPETADLDRASSVKSMTITTAPEPEKTSQSIESAPQVDGKTPSDTSNRDSPVGIWGPWRQNPITAEPPSTESTSGYQRAARSGRSMKVLKPSSSKSISSIAAPMRPTAAPRTSTPYEIPPEIRRKSQVESTPLKWESKRL